MTEGHVSAPHADIVYGVHPVEALLQAEPERVVRLHVLKGARGGLARLISRARGHGIPFDFSDRARLDRLAGTGKHQGAVAQVAAFAYAALDDLLKAAEEKPPGLVIALDEVTDPHNLGAVVRTAEAAGAHGVMIPKRRAAPFNAAAAKAAAGAHLFLPMVRVDNMSRALDRLKESGFWVCGLDANGTVALATVDLKGPTVLVLGSEGKGLRPGVARRCDQLARIPLAGRTPSLNVSVAAAVGIFTVLSQRQGWGR